MTQRERPISDGASSPAGVGCVWEELFQNAAPGRQQQLLALAGREGVLYAHELPPANNGAVKRALLPALLNGQIHDLPSFRAAAVECTDACLDDAQRAAVACALQTPDVCLIQGHAGSGKSRTALEIASQAVARGERVLLLAPTTAGIDCLLEQLDGRDGVCAVRCLSRGESLTSLPPGLRRLTFEERLRSFQEQTLPAARQTADEAARRCARHRDDESVWINLADNAVRLDAMRDERDGCGGAVETETKLAASRTERDERLARLDAGLAELRAEVEKVRGARQTAVNEFARLAQLAEAQKGGRWWNRTWWRARREGDLSQRMADLQKRQTELAAATDQLSRALDESAAERAEVEARFQEEVGLLRQREEDRCRLMREDRQRERTLLSEQIRSAYRGLTNSEPPDDLSAAAVREGCAAWSRRREQDEREAARASHWAEALEKALPALPERLARCANILGAVTSALTADPHFGDNASPRTTFDLLILEDAHFVTESEFLTVARRARRWVLIGEPTDDVLPRVSGLARPNTLRPGFFQRLWRLLHSDPSRLPYAWFHRDDRLVCRLRPASAEDEKWIASEYLADRPEIELRITSPPRVAPRLVEVLFPGATPIHEAKGFIFRELDELPLQAYGRAFRWRENADRWTLDLSDGAVANADVVNLTEGVCERIGVHGLSGWQTCAIEFSRPGWTRDGVEHWVEEHLQTRDLGRTVVLNAPHRGRPALARFLSALLFDGACLPDNAEDGVAVVFVPVPSQESEPARRRPDSDGQDRRGSTATAAPRLRPFRVGAGLESDLADPRPLDPLPTDLRAALPCRGLVNLFEARAVVRKLENLLADPEFCGAAEEWAGRPRRISDPSGSKAAADKRPALAVMALYPAQAELIRLLAAQSPAVTAAPLGIEVGTPDSFRQRECFAALIGLTRSHSHRAVPFGDDPSLLPMGLTRAAGRVILFGDPGTLARRCQWNGAVDHLDETAGERERGLLARLMAYLHGHGPYPSTFRLHESGRL